MASLDDQLRTELARREEQNLRRTMRTIPPGVIDLASNDYLGLARDPEVIAAACEATQRYGAGAGASRLVSGHTTLHQQLEAELAAFKGCETALVFPSGYQTNLAVVTALATPDSIIYCDKRNHASLIDACRLATAQRVIVRYYDSLDKLRALLKRQSTTARSLIVTDTVFSMDGDLADLPALSALAREHDAVLVLDDAHGTGTLGANGRGAVEHWNLPHESASIVHIGTLSKAIGAQGGFVAASQVLIDWLVNAARPFIYSTGLNPAACGAALAALNIIQREPQRIVRLREITQRLATGLKAANYEARLQPSPIIPVIIGDEAKTVRLSKALLEHGVWCPAIRPPTVPAGTSRLRVTASSELTDSDVDRALAAFATVRPGPA